MTKTTPVADALREKVAGWGQGAMGLSLAYVGVSSGLFSTLNRLGSSTVAELAAAAERDPGYVARYCDAAFASGLLEQSADEQRLELSELGRSFVPEVPGTLMPMAVMSTLTAHMLERAAGLMESGEQPGEEVLGERESVLPWFGPMLEHTFGVFFERQILPGLSIYKEVDDAAGTVVDLGCGNGWYLRRLAARYPRLRGVGLDGIEANIAQARAASAREGLAERLSFSVGDIHHFANDEPVAMIAMNRALHHVWDEKENVFRILSEHLVSGGSAVIWEPNWPGTRAALREHGRQRMALQNLSEHVQGNHFLAAEEIARAFEQVGMHAEVQLFANENEAVVIGTKP